MHKPSIRPTLAAIGLATLAVGATPALAGHLNTVLEADLDGREQVSADASKAMAGDANARGKAYVFTIDNSPTTLCYILVDLKQVAELAQAPGNGRAAHIHEGARGSNGPVVVNLAWPQDGQAGDCFAEGTAGKFPTAEAGLVQRILKNPQDFYVNVHNSAYPGGAVRGQLADTANHRH
jgi:hypothetical protein